MADTPNLRSKEQIAGDLIDGVLARLRKDMDLNQGSVLTQLIEAISQTVFKGSADMISMIDAQSIDRSSGEALQRLANDKKVPIFPASASTGVVSITDTSFEKISTRVYSGQPAPVAGSFKIYVTDASKFNTKGKIYIGRGTTNVEGPLDYDSVQQEAGGAYWSITLNSTSPTTKFHNVGESIVLAQGGARIISSGTVLKTAQGTSISSVQFKTTSAATIIDGETTVVNIPVKCESQGKVGNVPRGSIKEAIGLPFSASVFNNNAFANGKEADTDDDIRARIKAYEQAKAKGTDAAIETAANGVIAKDELKKVTSAKVVGYSDSTSALIFDDGTGYEPNFIGASFETVVDQAIGGELEVQLRQKPISQARIVNVIKGPYNMESITALAVEVNGKLTTHYFNPSTFKVPSSATCFEIAADINSNSNLNFNCSTANNGTNLVLYPRDKNSNSIMVVIPTIADANYYFGFPKTEALTLRLYKNDKPLHQDGLVAEIYSKIKSNWSTAISSGDSLKYIVDNTSELTVVFTASDFQRFDPEATMSSVSSLDLWQKVFNSKMPGVKITVVGETICFASSRGNSNDASIEFTGGTLLSQIFDLTANLSAQGREPDFTLNRQTGQIGFAESLTTGDKITAGSQYARGNISSTTISGGLNSKGRAWFIVDGDAQSIQNNLSPSAKISFQKIGTEMKISAISSVGLPEGFELAQPNDWLIIWANETDNSALIANQGIWRIKDCGHGFITVEVGNMSVTNAANLNISNGRMVVVRSKAPVQELDFTATSGLTDFITQAREQLSGITIDVVGSRVKFSTASFDENGEIYVAALDEGGQALGLEVGTSYKNIYSHYGFVTQTDSEVNFPSFSYSQLGLAYSDSQFLEPNYEKIGGQESDFIEILSKYDTTNVKEITESNKNRRSFAFDFDRSLNRLYLLPPSYMNSATVPSGFTGEDHRSIMREGDRYTLRTGYIFDSNDSSVVIVDSDTTVKTYTLPVARKLKVSAASTPTLHDFSATDAQSSLEINNPASFYGFDFSNFKVFRQAQTTLTDGTYEIKFKSVDFGPAGNKMRVGFTYPDSASNTELSHLFSSTEAFDVAIKLPVKDLRTPNWDHTTSFVVSVSTVNAKDIVTFTYKAGTKPTFTVGGADIHVGDIGFIGNTDFLSGNKNIKGRVISVTETSFAIEILTGSAIADQLTFSDIQNQNGLITITTAVDHGITTGQRVGLYDTGISSGTTKPMDGSYVAAVISPNQFSVAAPSALPGGTVTSAVYSATNKLVTVTTQEDHNLTAGNIIKAGADGLAAVYSVLTSKKFQYIRNSAPATVGPKIDFQSWGPSIVKAISTVNKVGNVVTVTTSAPHGFSPLSIVKMENLNLTDWSSATTYGVNDIVEYSGQYYISLTASNTNNNPISSTTNWAITAYDLSGTFVLETASGSTFTYTYPISGNASAASGTASKFTPVGALARSIAGATSENLQFASIETTAQAAVDYVSANLSAKLIAEVANGNTTAIINKSTADNDLSVGYLVDVVNRLITTKASRYAKFTTVTGIVPKGSTVSISGLSSPYDQYNDNYTVIDSYYDPTIPGNVMEVQTKIIGTASGTYTVHGDLKGSTPMSMMSDGENSVKTTNLGALAGSPMFQVKNPWINAPAVDEEIRLVAATADQLTRFWNKLIVSGISNVADLQLTKYGRQLQISTRQFGASGSIQVAGGTSNKLDITLVGAGQQIDNKLGSLQVSYDNKKGLMPRQWLTVSNAVRQNKEIDFNNSTQVKVHTDGIELIDNLNGKFQTKRLTTQDATTQFKVEYHGDFLAFVHIGGTSPSIASSGVKEGDWVRLRNINASGWIASTTYVQGDRVYYSGRNYTSLVNSNQAKIPDTSNAYDIETVYSLGDTVTYRGRTYTSLQNVNVDNNPETSPTYWKAYWMLQEFDKSNLGIFQVVRVFGDDAFWVKNTNGVEEVATIGNAENLKFYSYDSVMPGDNLVISTDLFGSQVVGRYTVSIDEAQFPEETRVWITEALNPVVTSFTVLGGEYLKINIEEKSPLTLYKRVFGVGPSSDTYTSIITDSPELIDRINSSLGASLSAAGKLGFNQDINFGIDAYRYYVGLIQELNKIIYGDSSDPISYPGVRASGTDIDIKEAIVRRITAAFSIRVNTGIPFSEIRDRVKSAVAGYVNSLGVGESVSISKMIAAANSIPGVISVAVTYPTFSAGNDLIPVSSFEKAYVVDPTIDITVSVI